MIDPEDPINFEGHQLTRSSITYKVDTTIRTTNIILRGLLVLVLDVRVLRSLFVLKIVLWCQVRSRTTSGMSYG